jgi:hypothetical protein
MYEEEYNDNTKTNTLFNESIGSSHSVGLLNSNTNSIKSFYICKEDIIIKILIILVVISLICASALLIDHHINHNKKEYYYSIILFLFAISVCFSICSYFKHKFRTYNDNMLPN